MTDKPRLIEHAFPLKQASLDSVHEKNVRHGHISTLHIWPARRPLAACRAALIATLLPDPGIPEERQKLCEKIGGKVVKKTEKKKMPNGRIVEREKEETEGGILHWKRETENAETLEWFRQEIRKAYGGRAPKVLDPFAGGGAIPLEAMRLGCEVTAADINPVAWFILKCTLEYPQRLAGKTHALPAFILEDEKFMTAFYKAHPEHALKTKRSKKKGEMGGLFETEDSKLPEANLAWHVRAWGKWVLDRARRDLAKFYPTYSDFEPLKPGKAYEKKSMRLVPLKDNGTPDLGTLNAEFSDEYLTDKKNPRWVAKPTVAYLWARTVTCKNCRATVPLLKTRWLCKKPKKRTLLTMEPNADKAGMVFGIQNDVPVKGGNAAQSREHDKRIGAGTMSRSGAKCPRCSAILTMEDIRLEGKTGNLGSMMTAVVIDTPDSKAYRLPTGDEFHIAMPTEDQITAAFKDVPFGVPDEPTPSAEALGMRVPLYGFDRWRTLFTPRQLMALGTFVSATRAASDEMVGLQYPTEYLKGVGAYLACGISRLADYGSTLCFWTPSEFVCHTFTRFALPITWDFVETNFLSDTTGNFGGAMDWVSRVVDHTLLASTGAVAPKVLSQSSMLPFGSETFDAIVTDPPYYDAIPYSDLMDLFYIWLRRGLHGTSHTIDASFAQPLSPKWDHNENDGELIDDRSRHGKDATKSKQVYEDGMARVFVQCATALKHEGRLVIVFANKQPDAWETLVSAIIRAGFTVDGSWPIQTEREARMRAFKSAALASSVWLVCKKRATTARPGWDNKVLEEMRENIGSRLREFWDAGIRGPDFVWAATGPALEAYSKHPVVKKANDPGQAMGVGEFLTHVRRMVVDFVVGQVLTGDGDGSDIAAADRMDAPTAYYLLHRNDFGLDEAPFGACILYATACGLSDHELETSWGILARTGGNSSNQGDDEGDSDPDANSDSDGTSDSGSKVKLRTWVQRKHKSMGYEAPGGQPVPLIDRIHRLMHLWRAGDVMRVDEYLDEYGLRRQELFKRLLQSLIELSSNGTEERSLLESISNHVQAKGATLEDRQVKLG